MVSFGGSSKKKSNGSSKKKSNDTDAIQSGSTPTSSPSKKSENATPPKSGGGFFRKALGTPTKDARIPTPTTPSTPPITTPDSSTKIKERPAVDTIDVPLQSKIPSPPGNAIRDTTSLLDNSNMYRIDSVLSDLSGSQPATVAGASSDPPAFILRTSSIEAASGSSGYVNSNSVKEPTPVASNVVTSSTAESIVTKVLGIVDISCVSSGLVPSTPPRAVAPTATNTQPSHDAPLKPTYSFQPEWGVAPEDEEGTLPEPKSLGSGGNGSEQSNAGKSNNPSNTNTVSNGGSSIKRELAEIAARASAPSTLQFDHDGMVGAVEGESGNKNYRRYHETFELVYTEPTGKKNKKSSTSRETSLSASKNKSPTVSNNASNTQRSKGLRINKWVVNQWKVKKQSTGKDSPQKPLVITPLTPPLGIESLEGNASRNDRSDLNDKKMTSASIASVTAETTTTPPTDASSIDNNCSTVVENIETTKGFSDIDTTVVVTATTGSSSINVATLPDESKGKKGGNKSWYRFNNKVETGTTKKEKKVVGFEHVMAAPKLANRSSPTKEKVFKNKSVLNRKKTSDLELQSNPTKIVLKSIKSSNMVLETVAEEEYVDDTTELKVRVPGFHNEDSYLSDQDLIGSEIVEEIYTTLNKSIEQEEMEQKQEKLETAKVDEELIHEVNKQELFEQKIKEVVPDVKNDAILLPPSPVRITSDGYQECPDVATTPAVASAVTVQQQKPRSWKYRLGLKKGDVETSATVDSETVGKVQPNPDSTKPTDTNKTKPQWKAAVDPASGRTYYYHKKTRETTWTRPPDWDLSHPKAMHITNDTKQYDEVDEIDRAMQSNASPKDVVAVGAALANRIDAPAEEKAENVDSTMCENTVTKETKFDDTYQVHEGDDNEDDEFPSNLDDLVDSKPFDEPGRDSEYPDDERKDEKSMTTARTRTTTSIYSGFSSRFSTKSRISEVTQPIKNLSSNKPDIDASHASISTKHEDLPTSKGSLLRSRRPNRIPKNIPVPRLRELNVEEFTTRDRDFKARTTRLPKLSRPSGENDGTYVLSNNHETGNTDNDDADADRSTVSYAATDSISALSEADLSFVDRKEAYEDARRRALDRAIAQEDWDLAAKLSESMRKTIKTANNGNRPFPSEWVQSEMDRFISENDWDAVASYIAHVRANANEASQKQILNQLATDPRSNSVVAPNQVSLNRTAGAFTRNLQSNSSDVSGTSNPQKIFGARSQLQHRDLHSVESHSSYSTTFDSEYTSESYEQRSEDEKPHAPVNRPRQQEFAC